MSKVNKNIIYTVEDRCEVCYSCVRVCPAKAISIRNGQAQVIQERCIACGNCVKVCTRGAKMFVESTSELLDVLNTNSKTVVCIAPSFPAEFTEATDYKQVVGMFRALGFNKVVEVAYGADLVAREYLKLLNNPDEKKFISSDCPAIVNYITKYHPHLTDNLAPVVSPMMAMARVIKNEYGNNYRQVFVGPCIAKKSESEELELVLTFKEIREIFRLKNITHDNVEPSDFDPPYSGRGAIFPVSRGIIQSINVSEDFVDGNVVVADGKNHFKEAINEFDNGLIADQHLELLCCEGCIMGPGMSVQGRPYQSRAYVTRYVKEKLKKANRKEWKSSLAKHKSIDLSRSFLPDDSRVVYPSHEEIVSIWNSMDKINPADRLDCQACGYESCEEHAVAVLRGLAEIDMCLPYMIKKLHQSIEELNLKNDKLASMQQALKQSEKLAHLGQLSAGIAHELNNPLGVVIMYSNILLDEIDSNNPMAEDLKMITDQALRCKNIVGGLLNFARKNKLRLDNISLTAFINRALKSVIVPNNIQVQTSFMLKNDLASIDAEQMTQALTNILKNAIEAMPNGGNICINLSDLNDIIKISIEDTGTGIAKEHMDKIFTPFFTTKAQGKGTGLGMPTTYGIIKMHQGKINIVTNADPETGPTGTKFIIEIPRYINEKA